MRLKSLFSVASLESFGGFDRAEISAMGALIEYLDITQKGQLPRLQWPVKESTQRVMQIDAATRRNLEITQSIQGGGRAGSLLATVDPHRNRGWRAFVGTADFIAFYGCAINQQTA
jgi:DNA mismatch repair protein MutS